jgi:superoxide dismutase
MAHKVSPLRFAYDALDPYIDAETMELHHDKHHQTYVDNLNEAIEPYPRLVDLTTEDLLRRLDQVPEGIRTAVRSHGGGHANHQLFWRDPRTEGRQVAERRDRRRHHEALWLGMGVSRREPIDRGARDHVAAQPGQRGCSRGYA